MPMPASGCLEIATCPNAVACTSIGKAVCNTSSGSLSALSTAAGKTAPHSMLEFYGYCNFIVTPTTIANIPSAGATCSVTVCAPAVNTYTVADACTWLVPAIHEPPSPAGTTHSIQICANTGAARSGIVCYSPSFGTRMDVTLCQLIGQKVVDICETINCSTGIYGYTCGLFCPTPAFCTGEYAELGLCGYICLGTNELQIPIGGNMGIIKLYQGNFEMFCCQVNGSPKGQVVRSFIICDIFLNNYCTLYDLPICYYIYNNAEYSTLPASNITGLCLLTVTCCGYGIGTKTLSSAYPNVV